MVRNLVNSSSQSSDFWKSHACKRDLSNEPKRMTGYLLHAMPAKNCINCQVLCFPGVAACLSPTVLIWDEPFFSIFAPQPENPKSLPRNPNRSPFVTKDGVVLGIAWSMVFHPLHDSKKAIGVQCCKQMQAAYFRAAARSCSYQPTMSSSPSHVATLSWLRLAALDGTEGAAGVACSV